MNQSELLRWCCRHRTEPMVIRWVREHLQRERGTISVAPDHATFGKSFCLQRASKIIPVLNIGWTKRTTAIEKSTLERKMFFSEKTGGLGQATLYPFGALKHLVKEEFPWRTSTSNQFYTSRAERSKSPEGQAGLWGESPIDLTPHTNRSLKACRVSEHGKSKGLPEHSQAKWPEDQW